MLQRYRQRPHLKSSTKGRASKHQAAVFSGGGGEHNAPATALSCASEVECPGAIYRAARVSNNLRADSRGPNCSLAPFPSTAPFLCVPVAGSREETGAPPYHSTR
jgi:hypothetical protein